MNKQLQEEIINFDIRDWDDNYKHCEFLEFLENNPYFNFNRLPSRDTDAQRDEVYHRLSDYWWFEPDINKTCYICKISTNSYIHSVKGHCIKCLDCYKNNVQ